MSRLAGALTVARYWGHVVVDAFQHAVPKKPREHVKELAVVFAATVILAIWIAPGRGRP